MCWPQQRLRWPLFHVRGGSPPACHIPAVSLNVSTLPQLLYPMSKDQIAFPPPDAGATVVVPEGAPHPRGVPAVTSVDAGVQRFLSFPGGWRRWVLAGSAMDARRRGDAGRGSAAVVLLLHASRCVSLRPALQGEGGPLSVIRPQDPHAARLTPPNVTTAQRSFLFRPHTAAALYVRVPRFPDHSCSSPRCGNRPCSFDTLLHISERHVHVPRLTPTVRSRSPSSACLLARAYARCRPQRPRVQEVVSRVCNAWTLWHHGLWVMHHVYGHHSFTGGCCCLVVLPV